VWGWLREPFQNPKMESLQEFLLLYCVAAVKTETLYDQIKAVIQEKKMNQKDCKAMFLSKDIIEKIKKKIMNKNEQTDMEEFH
jgi:vacuolar-type H+-ATPase subunit F/Vma7